MFYNISIVITKRKDDMEIITEEEMNSMVLDILEAIEKDVEKEVDYHIEYFLDYHLDYLRYMGFYDPNETAAQQVRTSALSKLEQLVMKK